MRGAGLAWWVGDDRPGVVELHGDLDISGIGDLAAALSGRLVRPPGVILDLAGLDFLDCSALWSLVQWRQVARQAGGDLVLAAPRGIVLRLLTLTGLSDVFTVYVSVQGAAGAAAASPAALGAPWCRARRARARRPDRVPGDMGASGAAG
jgi:anti-anti-sigma factor